MRQLFVNVGYVALVIVCGDAPPAAAAELTVRPAAAGPGIAVTITGSDLQHVDQVTVGDAETTAAFAVVSKTELRVTVPNVRPGATRFSVTRAGQSTPATIPFEVLRAPQIPEVLPRSNPPSAAVSIKGTALSSVTKVSFGAQQARFALVSDSQITTHVPSGVSMQTVSIQLSGRNVVALSEPDFHVLAVAPVETPSPPDIALPPEWKRTDEVPPATDNGYQLRVSRPEYSAYLTYRGRCDGIRGDEYVYRTIDDMRLPSQDPDKVRRTRT